MTVKEFRKRLLYIDRNTTISSQYLLNILSEHFQGEDWYSMYIDPESVNIEIVYNIIRDTQYIERRMRLKELPSRIFDFIADHI